MCYVWEGKIEKCEHCSASDFQNVLRVIYHIEPVRPTHPLVARTRQHPLNQGHPQPPRQDVHIDLHRGSAAEDLSDLEQDLTHQARPPSSRQNALINGAAQHKRQRADTDQPSSSAHHAPINGTAQNKRQKLNLDQESTLRHGGRIEDQRQHGRQGPNPDQISSSGQDTRMHGTARLTQQTQSHGQLSSSRRDARSDWVTGRGQKERHQDPPSSSKHHTITDLTDLTDEEEDEGMCQKASQGRSRVDEIEVLTAGMNKLPPPCWGDERVILPLVKQQLENEEFFRRQEQELSNIWAMYGKEREALTASYTPEPETHWTPDFEQGKIFELETPFEEEIWARSVLEGEAQMRKILDEDETGRQEAQEEANIWTREEGGMLSSAMLKRLLRVLTLKASLEEERLQRSDESQRLPYPWPIEEEMRLHTDL